MTTRLATRKLKTKFGEFIEILYSDGHGESIALVLGDVRGKAEVLCRIHSACIGGHVFNSIECDCAAEMAAAQSAIQDAGRGVIIYLDQEGKGNGHLALMLSIPFKEAGSSQSEAYEKAGYAPDARTYDPVAKILNALEVRSIILLTDSSKKAEELKKLGVDVSDTRTLAK
ncbi:MAG: GTP cyclohydrolase [Pyrinomonadaceae bacterium]